MSLKGQNRKMDDVIVKLDVGGCLYTTKLLTLTRSPGSMLSAMFSGELDRPIRDANGAYVIDRDGPIFRHVLNFFRQGRLVLPEDFKEWDQLASEADFYKVEALVKAVKAVKAVKKEKCRVGLVEIDQAGTYLSVKYIGSSETLENLPGLLQILNSGTSETWIDVIGAVKTKGNINIEMQELEPEQKRMSIFRKLNHDGFKLKTAPCKMEGKHGMKWTFLRKI